MTAQRSSDRGGGDRGDGVRDSIYEMIRLNDEKHDAAHRRLREDLRELQTQHENLFASLTTLRETARDNAGKIETLRATPPNVENVIMTPRVLVAIVVFTITIVGGVWSSTYGLRSDVRDILTRMEAQKSALEAADKLADMQSAQMKSAIEAMQRRIELFQYEQQSMKETLVTGSRRTK